MLAWLPSRPTAVSVHSPLTVSRPRTVSPRSVKKSIVASRSRTAMPTFSSLMGMRCTLPSQAICPGPWAAGSDTSGQGTNSQCPAPDSRSISRVRARSLTRSSGHGVWVTGSSSLLLCREGDLARSASRATLGLRDKLLDGVAGGAMTHPDRGKSVRVCTAPRVCDHFGDRDSSAGGETRERSIRCGCSPAVHGRATDVVATGSARQAHRERRLP